MAYATASQLRARFAKGDDYDAFAQFEDADLTQALTSASNEIDSWRPSGTLSDAAVSVLADKSLTLARMLAFQDSSLSPEHPIVRDGLEVRVWLKALARGAVNLPTDVEEPAETGGVSTGERTLAYTSDVWGQYDQ